MSLETWRKCHKGEETGRRRGKVPLPGLQVPTPRELCVCWSCREHFEVLSMLHGLLQPLSSLLLCKRTACSSHCTSSLISKQFVCCKTNHPSYTRALLWRKRRASLYCFDTHSRRKVYVGSPEVSRHPQTMLQRSPVLLRCCEAPSSAPPVPMSSVSDCGPPNSQFWSSCDSGQDAAVFISCWNLFCFFRSVVAGNKCCYIKIYKGFFFILRVLLARCTPSLGKPENRGRLGAGQRGYHRHWGACSPQLPMQLRNL